MVILLVVNSLPLNVIAEAIESDDKPIWYGEFYDNHIFEGESVKEEFDSIDFSWAKDNPMQESESPLFSAIYTSTVNSDHIQKVQLQGTVHGELVLYLNDEKVFEFDEDAKLSFNEDVELQKGVNDFRIEYKNNPEESKLKLDVIYTNKDDFGETDLIVGEETETEKDTDITVIEELPTDKWLAYYYDTLDLTGEKQEELVEEIQFDDFESFSDNISLNEIFSASYSKAYVVSGQTNYKVSGTVQGGIKIYVEEELLYEDSTKVNNQIDSQFTLNEGTHHIRVEYKNDNEKLPSINLIFTEEAVESEETGNQPVDEESATEESEIVAPFKAVEELSPVVTQRSTLASTNHWTGKFYPNTSFTGNPVVDTYDKIDFFWGNGSPHPSIPNDKFSAVFTKKLKVNKAEFYRISGRADDGIRVYLDNKLIINHWKDGVNNFTKDILLTAGTHDVKVEYYDNKYSASLRVDLKPIKEIVDENWEAAYYPNANFDGDPVLKKFERLDLNWGTGSPDARIPNDNFTATFHKKLVVKENSEYLFSGRADDGIRVYVDEKQIINRWQDGVNIYSSKEKLAPGEYLIRVEYYDNKYGAAINLDIKDLTAPSNVWDATYYPTSNLQGVPVKKKVQKLDLNWGSGSPAAGIPSDNFSAIFSKSILVPKAGNYRFSGRADDGLRIFIDGEKVIDLWGQGVNVFDQIVELKPGTRDIRVEYFEEKYGAAIKVDIDEYSIPKNEWLATYYPNNNLTGLPIKRYEKVLDLNWGDGSPADGIPSDDFSAVFEKNLELTQGGTYRFSGRADDGIRIFVDGVKIIDHWQTGVNSFNHIIELGAGNHNIKVEYFEAKYGAAIKLDINELTKPKDEWIATYYPTKNFTGASVEKIVPKLDLNWGSGSPAIGIPSDNFSAIFKKDILVSKTGLYQFRGRADDGMRIFVDGVKIVDVWQIGVNTFNHLVELQPGIHDIRVEYFDEKYGAAIKLDIDELAIPKDEWEAAYYPTNNFTGVPVKRFEKKLDLHWGNGSPATGIPTDDFTATFKKSILVSKAGLYQFTGKADDGLRVYVDGVKVIDVWQTGVNTFNHLVELEPGIHDIKVEYFEEKYGALIKLEIDEFVIPNDAWLAIYYPTKNFTGLPVKRYENKLDLNWGSGSPDASIPVDNFSAIFEKTIKISEAGAYQLSGRADDGIRVFINGKKELDLWGTGVNVFSKNVDLPVGDHKIRVEYYDEKYSAAIKVDINKATNQTIYKETNYNSTFNEALVRQMRTSPQTDKKYPAYISKDGLTVDASKKSGTVKSGAWNIRGLPGTNDPSWVLGILPSGNVVSIIGETVDSVGRGWYQITYNKSWVNASNTDVAYYMNPANFSTKSKEYYQFLSLKGSALISTKEVNDKILSGKGTLQGKAEAFSEASRIHDVNEIYLISHALLETGNGNSTLAKGIRVSSVDGKPVTPRVVYNTYGIGAFDNCAEKCGSEYAYKMQWFTTEAAIVGGASFISKNYVNAGQDTLYKMRWNPGSPATHQYATDIGWAVKQTNRMYDFYSMLDTYTLTFDIPVYR